MISYREAMPRPLPINISMIKRIAKIIHDYSLDKIRNNPSKKMDEIFDCNEFIYEFNLKDIKKRSIFVSIRICPMKSSSASKHIVGAKSRKSQGIAIIDIYVNSKCISEEIINKESDFYNSIFSVLVHEITHVMDIVRKDEKLNDKTREQLSEDKNYYKNTNEMAANINEIILIAKNKYKKLLGKGLNIKQAEEILSNNEKYLRIKDFLDDKQKKKIILVLFNVFRGKK